MDIREPAYTGPNRPSSPPRFHVNWKLIAHVLGWTAGFFGVAWMLLLSMESAVVTLFSFVLLLFGAAAGGWFTRSWWFVLVYPSPLLIGAVLFYLWTNSLTAEYERTGTGSLGPGLAIFAAILCFVVALVVMAIAAVAVAWSESRATRARRRMYDENRDYAETRSIER